MSTELVPIKDVRRGLPSASALERLFVCPGSYQLSKLVPPDQIPESEYAEAGQRIHAARAEGDVTNMDLDEADLVVQMVDDEERIYHHWCDDYQITDAEVFQERRVWLMRDNHHLCSAQIDFYALSRTKRMALVLDRKSGRKGVQPPTRNWQLKGSLVILASLYSLVGGRVAIVQPFAKRQVPCDYGPDDLYAEGGALDQLYELLAWVEDPAAIRVTGPQCQYCPAKAICPEAQELTRGIATIAGLSWSVQPAEWKLDLWERCRIAQDIIDQMNHLIKADVRRGLIPGLALTKDVNTRAIPSASELSHKLKDAFPDDIDLREAFDGMVKVSLGAIEDFMRERKGMSKVDAKAWVNTELNDLIVRGTREGHVIKEKK